MVTLRNFNTLSLYFVKVFDDLSRLAKKLNIRLPASPELQRGELASLAKRARRTSLCEWQWNKWRFLKFVLNAQSNAAA